MRALLVVLALVIGLGGLYYFQWNRQATHFEKLAQSYLDSINAKAEAQDVDFSVAHQGISVTGFPFAHHVVLKNPTITSKTSMDGLVAWLSGQNTPLNQMAHNTLIENRTEVAGTISFGVDYLASRAEFVIDGTISGEDRISGEAIQWSSENASEARCHVDFSSQAGIDFLKISLLGQKIDSERLLRQLTSVECQTPPQTYVRAGSNEPLLSSGAMELGFKDIDMSNPNAVAMRMFLRLPDVVISDAYTKYYASIGSGVPPSQYELNPFEQLAVVGAQSTAFDLAIAMRDPGLEKAIKEDTPLNDPQYILVDVKEFSIRNKLLNISLPFFFEMDKQGEVIQLRIRSNGEAHAEPAFDLALSETISGSLKDPAMLTQFAAAFPEADAEAAQAFILEVLPRLSGFGTLKTALDFEATGSATSPVTSGGLTLRAFDVITDAYQLKMSGSFDIAEQKGLANIDCHQCDQFVADVVEYNNRVQRALQAINSTYQPTLISTEFYEGIMVFLKGLNAGKQENVISIALASDGQGNVTVSGKPMLQVMMEGMQLFQPLLSPSAAQ
jgi:hypothetical protein